MTIADAGGTSSAVALRGAFAMQRGPGQVTAERAAQACQECRGGILALTLFIKHILGERPIPGHFCTRLADTTSTQHTAEGHNP